MVLSRREKTIAIAAGAALLLLALDQWVFAPLISMRERSARSVQSLQQKVKKEQTLVDNRRQTAPRWQEMLKAGLKSDPAEAESLALHALRDRAEECGVALTLLKPERLTPSDKKARMAEIVVQAAGTGKLEGIARLLRIPPARVQGIATFYAQFRFHPPGKHTVTICRGTACHVRGSGKLLDELQGSLCVRPQETTADGLFTLETVACFGSCALAPVIAIGGQVHGQLSPEKARKLILGLRRTEARTSRAGRKRPKAGRPSGRK
jgi:NADH-quinone oxidoreductase subunit E